MTTINVNQASAGMVLDQDINVSGGRLLLSRSHVLNEESIDLLKKHGFQEISIQAEDKSKEPPTPEKHQTVDPLSFINIGVSNDAMHASLTIDAALGKEIPLSGDMLKRALELNGVVFGIKESALTAAVNKWPGHNGMYKIDIVAEGIPAVPHHEGPFVMKVKHVNCKSMLEEVSDLHYYWELAKVNDKIERVDPGSVLAERAHGTPSIPGKTVRGELIFSEEIIEKKVTIGEGARLNEEGNKVTSSTIGVALCVADTIDVIPLDFNSSLEVEISSDKMSASLIVHPAGTNGAPPDTESIYELLESQGVVYGVNQSKIEEICENCGKGRYPEKQIVVAKGDETVDGEDGKVELLISTESSLKPKVNENGVADYKNVDIIVPVSSGKKLAKLIPPQKGRPGKDITGNETPAADGKPAQLPGGKNTDTSGEQADYLIATTDGIVKYDGTSINIVEGYVVEGNVDFSTGNIKYERSVTINGDISSGFGVECGGDLQVSGTIEDCAVKVGGNILCKHGFIGQGRGLIEAKGDVNLGFIKNQTVRSRGNVNIAKEALNSTIYSRKSIEIHGGSLSVAGGTLVAKHSIIVNIVGNSNGTRTNLEVGMDYALSEEMVRIDSQLEEMHLNLKKMVATNKRFETMYKTRRQLSKENIVLWKKVNETLKTYKKQIQILEDRKKVASSKIYDIENAFIKIEKAAMPGTMFKIFDRHYLVKEKITGPKTIRALNNEIKVI